MRKHLCTCDRCGKECNLEAERPPIVPSGNRGPCEFALIVSHSTSRIFDLCEDCFAATIEFVDPKREWRKAMDNEIRGHREATTPRTK